MPYTITITIDYSLDPAVNPDLLVAIAEAALQHEHAPEGAVSLVITDDVTVQALNRDYRGLDEPTDVLSFGLGGFARPAEPAEPVDDAPSFILPEDLPLEIGEIVISHPYAARTATSTVRPIRDELALLTVHGVLHLLGHDHLGDAEGDEMRAREAAILGRFGISR